jgi:phospho-2-dehydro-3-deoxyheptonate aldolase
VDCREAGNSVAHNDAALWGLQVISRVIVDCSHGNSQKLHTNQPKVAADIGAQASCAQS